MAEPGDYIVVAREAKKTGQWFVGGVTDENRRTLTFKLDFLDKDRSYEATIYRDDDNADYKKNPKAYLISRQKLTSADSLSIVAAPGGGFAISFEIN